MERGLGDTSVKSSSNSRFRLTWVMTRRFTSHSFENTFFSILLSTFCNDAAHIHFCLRRFCCLLYNDICPVLAVLFAGGYSHNAAGNNTKSTSSSPTLGGSTLASSNKTFNSTSTSKHHLLSRPSSVATSKPTSYSPTSQPALLPAVHWDESASDINNLARITQQ